jgi:hypothetical protein
MVAGVAVMAHIKDLGTMPEPELEDTRELEETMVVVLELPLLLVEVEVPAGIILVPMEYPLEEV